MKKLAIALLFISTIAAYAKDLPSQSFNMVVNENGFEPNSLKVKAQTPTILKITRKTDATCARELVIPSKKIKVELPLNKEVIVNVGKLEKGEVKFGCAMEMMLNGVMFAE